MFPGSKDKYMKFEFFEEVLLNGMIIVSTEKNYVKKFRVRAVDDINEPSLLSGDVNIVPENVVRLSSSNILQNIFLNA